MVRWGSPGVAAGVAEPVSGSATDRFHGVRLPDDFDPLALLARPYAHGVVASYERPDRGFALVAVGAAAQLALEPGAPIAALRDPARALLGRPVAHEHDALRPRLLGGFAFDPARAPAGPWTGFPAGSLLLPRLLFVRDGACSGVVLAPGVDRSELAVLLARVAFAAPPAEPAAPPRVVQDFDGGAWQPAVSKLAASVRDGRYEKVVLAAQRELAGDEPIDPGATLERLRAGYPHCHVFSFVADGATFLGATPELLVSVAGGAVRALGLAGSARRGMTPAEDDALGAALLASAKDRREHEIVVRALRLGLAPLTDALHAPAEPELLRLPNIQHLATGVHARAREGTDLLALIAALHPTPAVCGWPTDTARRAIRAHERFERGWYAGAVGWLDAAGEGEFAVALRSALVRGSRAWVFAGAGIMGDSCAEDELAEIELKSRPLTGALTGGRA